MINLPILQDVQIHDYQLYPGTVARKGVDQRFDPGLTLILGANGLGKTTFVTLLYRLLTGTGDIPNLATATALGGKSLEVRERTRAEQATFANRVSDGGVGAEATLRFSLGDRQIEVTRQLTDLVLTRLTVDDQVQDVTERGFRELVVESCGVASFGDWILALRHLVFYFEDRQALIWDPTAQRQLLRLLFLPPETSAQWTTQEREVLELDSLVRNLQYGLNKETRRLAKTTKALGSVDEVRQSLDLLAGVQTTEQNQLDNLSDELADVASRRSQARLASLTADQNRENAVQEIERLELQSIAAGFPDATATARYLLSQILSESRCLTCGTHVPNLQQELERRVRDDQCVVCASNVSRHHNERAHHPRLLRKARKRARALEEQATTAGEARRRAEEDYDQALRRVSELTASTSRRSREIDELLQQLPPDEREVHEQRDAMASMRANLELRRNELATKRSAFAQFVQRVNADISDQRDAIKAGFDRYATGFLVEQCELAWQPRRSRVGETGELVEFAAFELAMSGASFESATRRSGPNQVSESQREFIDLSFRMALMEVASPFGGSLVIDAPESSLDAVFVTRAAKVLTTFASYGDNRLLITSNLVDGDLIPSLLRQSQIRNSRDGRVMDLLSIAAPTAATSALSADYKRIRRRLFERANESGS